jgi:aspartyl-tRNA(Asn)/glutamyl-tRNA(Gln) amidotransferase subunit C
MNIEDLQVTAQLAHLNMEEAELAAAFPAFEQMLGFFAAMQAADNDTAAFPEGFADDDAQTGSGAFIKPAAHFRSDSPGDTQTAFRNAGSAGLSGEAAEASLLDNSGDRDGRFILVPNVL